MAEDLTPEERELLAAEVPTGKPAPEQLAGKPAPDDAEPVAARKRREVRPEQASAGQPEAAPAAARGQLTPVQYDDDGWGDTPVQMRG